MGNAYWEAVRGSPFDWFILACGGVLIAAHVAGLVGRFRGRMVLFVQRLDRYRTACLLLVAVPPVLGLLGTLFGLMTAAPAELARGLPAILSPSVSGLLLVVPNLLLNALLCLAPPVRTPS